MTSKTDSEYSDLFLKTAKEHIQIVEKLLIGYESDLTNHELQKEIYRRIHSLKGSSTIMNHEKIADHCSKILEFLNPEGNKNVSSNNIASLFSIVKKIHDIVDTLESSKEMEL